MMKTEIEFQKFLDGFDEALSKEETYYSRKAFMAGAKSKVIISKESFLSQTSFKNVSGNWQFKGDITPERVYKIIMNSIGQ